jgi:inner membrane protein
MNGATHTATGALAGISLCMLVGPSFQVFNATIYTVATVFLSTTGSLIPDIDIPRSKMGQKFPGISRMFKHRGMTHTLLFPVILGVMYYFVSAALDPIAASFLANILFPFMFGWVVHILADMCNKKGVPVLWPLVPKRIHIASCKTGTWNEGAFLFLVGLAVFIQFLFKSGIMQKLLA